MKIDTKTLILCIGIVLIIASIWLSRSPKPNTTQSDEYRKIDSIARVIEQRHLRDSIRNQKADSLLQVVSNNNKVIATFVTELKKINIQLGQTITNINNLNANELVKFYGTQINNLK